MLEENKVSENKEYIINELKKIIDSDAVDQVKLNAIGLLIQVSLAN